MKNLRRRSFPAVLIVLNLIASLALGQEAQPPIRSLKPFPGPVAGEQSVELILVPAAEPVKMLVAAPLSAKLGGASPAQLVAAPEETDPRLEKFIKAFQPRRILFLGPGESPIAQSIQEPSPEYLSPGGSGFAEAIAIARVAWREAPVIITASPGEPAAALAASSLAARMTAPFAPSPDDADDSPVNELLRRAGCRRLILVSDDPRGARWSRGLSVRVEKITIPEAEKRLVRLIGAANVRCLVLAPFVSEANRSAAAVAPHYSLMRNALPVPCFSPSPEAAEARMASAIAAHGIAPRSVLVLGTPAEGIGRRMIQDPEFMGEYQVEVEPGAWPGKDSASPLGAARMPYDTLFEATLTLARGYVRDRILGGAPPKAVMIANPQPEYGTLPLAETVSRLTVEEFRNFGVHTDEFYNVPANDARILEVVGQASWVIYEGHVTDQTLFPEYPVGADEYAMGQIDEHDPRISRITVDEVLPPARPGDPEQRRSTTYLAIPEPAGYEFQEAAGDDAEANIDEAQPQPGAQAGPAPAADAGREAPRGWRRVLRIFVEDIPENGDENGNVERRVVSYLTVPISTHEPGFAPAPGGDLTAAGAMVDDAVQPYDPVGEMDMAYVQTPAPELHAAPIVTLQSCHSLSPGVAGSVFDAGGVALLGTMTSVHSASGSSFVKTFADQALYGGATLGEALRDARNYFLALARLKTARGHTQQAKAVRVALSFHLWGDPELEIRPRVEGEPRLEPVEAAWTAPNKARILTPAKRLSEITVADKYSARLMPGSQTAGLVRRVKDQPARRLMPLYFFRLDAPEGFYDAGYQSVKREGDDSIRGIFLPDPMRRYVWILYFPAKDRTKEEIVLEFGK